MRERSRVADYDEPAASAREVQLGCQGPLQAVAAAHVVDAAHVEALRLECGDAGIGDLRRLRATHAGGRCA